MNYLNSISYINQKLDKDKCTITIKGNDAFMSGSFPIEPVINATSYFMSGYQFSAKYKIGSWDGRKRLFNRTAKSFPAGLVFEVSRALSNIGINAEIIYKNGKTSIDVDIIDSIKLNGLSFEYPYDYQIECAKQMLIAERGIISAATNSGKSAIACLVVAALKIKTLFLVPGKDLLYQTRNLFKSYLEVDDSVVGIIGDGEWNEGSLVTIATIASIHKNLVTQRGKSYLNSIELVFGDEVHRGGSDTYYQILRACPAYYRFGLSGTPLKRTDGADLRLIGAMGPVIFEIKNKELIERGISSRANIEFVKVTQPQLNKWMQYPDVYKLGVVENIYRNHKLCQKIIEKAENGFQVLVLIKELEHGYKLDELIWKTKKLSFVPHQFISGTETSEVRNKALEDFKKGDLKVLIATSILDEGINLPTIDVLVLAGSGKSSIKTLQRLGRGLRKGGKAGILTVIDVCDLTHKYLSEHSLQRLSDYKAENCFSIKMVT